MLTVWKYELQPGETYLEIPAGSTNLSVQTQNGIPCLWVLVDTNRKTEPKVYEIYGTGHEIKNPFRLRKYVGTFLIDNDSLVFHVFEQI